MNDVFISYARPDRETAHRLADALEARGLKVWWDHDLAPGQKFAAVIAQELASARCVVVLWSHASVASNWVADEASEAQRRSVLVPAIIGAGVQPPLGFRGLHTADLSGWSEGSNSAEFQRLCQAVWAMARGEAPVPPPPPPPPPSPPTPSPPLQPPPSKLKRNVAIGASAVVALALFQAWQDGDFGGLSGSDDFAGIGSPPIQGPITWQDYVLRYNGRIDWDGQSSTASLSADIADMPSGRAIGQEQLTAQVTRYGPQQVEFGANFPVQADSQGNYPHSHNVNLRFQRTGSGWSFVHNCMRRPDGPEQCW